MKCCVYSPSHGTVDIPEPTIFETSDDVSQYTTLRLTPLPVGAISFQHYPVGEFSIFNNFFQIVDTCSITFESREAVLKVIAVLNGCAEIEYEGIGVIKLSQGQFTILYQPLLRESVLFTEQKELHIYNLEIPLNILEDLISIFPVDAFLTEIRQKKAATLFSRPGWITNEVLDTFSELLNIPQQGTASQFLFKMKIQGLFAILLNQKFYSGPIHVPEDVLEAVWNVKHIIESCVGEILTIEKLSSHVNIPENELKRNFLTVVGVQLSDFLVTARLKNGMLLLSQTDLPISEIATICGYAHTERFILSFKKHYGVAPLTLRRRNKNT